MNDELVRPPWLLKAWQHFFDKNKIDPGSVFKEPTVTSNGQGVVKGGVHVEQRTPNPEGGQYGDPRINS